MRARCCFFAGILLAVAAATAAAADPRDSVDRGQRLDTDALRDDAATNRLVQPSHPLQIAPPPAVPNAKTERKKRSGASSSR